MNLRSSATLIPALALVILVATTAGAAVEARVVRETIAPGETFDLLLRVRGADAGQEPAWSELGSDFDIVDARRSQRSSIVNGQRDQSVDWRIALAPRRAGELEIPGIAVGASRSEPLHVVVSDAAPNHGADHSYRAGSNTSDLGAAAPAVTLRVHADDETPYVQGRVLLTARILAGPDLLEGHLSDPQVDGAVLERVGEDESYQTLVDGEPRIAIERRYAVFPQRSGSLTVPPLVFEGRARDTRPPPSRARRDPFGGRSPLEDFFARSPFADDFFGPRARTVRAQSAGITLEVQPKPAAASDQWWIPAHSVEIIERWDSEPPVFRVGEPVSRTLAIRATGLSGAQLPDLSLPPVDGAKQYIEPALAETTSTQNEVVAIKAQRTSLIPTVEGPLTLPAVEIEWWHTTADAPRTARLEARVVQVLPGDASVAAAIPPRAEIPDAAPPADPTRPAEEPSSPLLPGPLWARVAGGVAIAGIALGLAFLGVRRRRAPEAPQNAFGSQNALSSQNALGSHNALSSHNGMGTQDAKPGATDAPAALRRPSAERALRRACQGSDPIAAAAALRGLARSRWPGDPPRTAAAWGRNLDSTELRDAIAELDRVRYSRDATAWCGDGLWQAYRGARGRTSAWTSQRRSDPSADRAHADSNGVLPSLYPSR